MTVTTAGGHQRRQAPPTTSATSPAPTGHGSEPGRRPATGGTSVTITGTNLTGATTVKFGSTSAAFTVNSASWITAVSPAGSGTVDMSVTTAGGHQRDKRRPTASATWPRHEGHRLSARKQARPPAAPR